MLYHYLMNSQPKAIFSPEKDALNEDSAALYIQNHPIRKKIFADNDQLVAKDLADGNVNLVFRVFAKNAPEKSVIVKQALPYARKYPDFKMPLERARIEYDVLVEHNKLAKGLCPEVYSFDETLFINVMEDLRGLKIMREGMLTQTVFPNAAKDIGLFLGRTLFYGSDFYLESAAKKARTVQFQNPVLTKVTEDLIYTFPFVSHETNRFPKSISAQMSAFYEDPKIRAAATACKYEFMTAAQTLLHGDLHTGSIMVSSDATKVMDPEFAVYGPIAFDVAAVVANYALSSFSQKFHAKDQKVRAEFCEYLKDSIQTIWTTFREEFCRNFEKDCLPEWRSGFFMDSFMSALETQVIRHSACEMVRRTVGMAHILELDEITDENALSDISSSIIVAASRLLIDGNPKFDLFTKLLP